MISRTQLISKCVEADEAQHLKECQLLMNCAPPKQIFQLMILGTPLKTKVIRLILAQYIGF